MTEQEYINTSDLARIRSMIAVSKNIIPANSKIINNTEFYKIMQLLYKLEQKLSSKTVIK
jgi:hypothetical protein